MFTPVSLSERPVAPFCLPPCFPLTTRHKLGSLSACSDESKHRPGECVVQRVRLTRGNGEAGGSHWAPPLRGVVSCDNGCHTQHTTISLGTPLVRSPTAHRFSATGSLLFLVLPPPPPPQMDSSHLAFFGLFPVWGCCAYGAAMTFLALSFGANRH